MLAGWPVLVEPALDAVVVTVEPVTVPVGSPPFFVGDRNCFLAATTAESVCALFRTSFARLFKALSAEQDVLSLLHSLPVGSVWFTGSFSSYEHTSDLQSIIRTPYS